MIIDFDKTEEKVTEGFKGGNGLFLSRMFDDGKVKIMRDVLKPGSSIGRHTHTSNCEIIFVTKGTLVFTYDGVEETATAGQAHYCPAGHEHIAENRTLDDAEFLAVVPETNK